MDYDALVVVSFGGPEKPEEVMPFLENVTRGRGIPRERLLGVAEHYYHFGGRSPINDQNRALIDSLRTVIDLPIYWGNRNWHPFLVDAVGEMQRDGVRHAAAFITSAFGSNSGCRQYREDIERALAETGDGAPRITPLPLFWDHPGFLGPFADNVRAAVSQFPAPPHVAFTAHSIPLAMAETAPYLNQLETACARVAGQLGLADWRLVYQSRSGAPHIPWLEPDILDHMRELRRDLVIAPIGFISDHMEVLYDLDTEAAALASDLGIRMVRAATVGTAPAFVAMIRDLLDAPPRACAPDCCAFTPPVRRPAATS